MLIWRLRRCETLADVLGTVRLSRVGFGAREPRPDRKGCRGRAERPSCRVGFASKSTSRYPELHATCIVPTVCIAARGYSQLIVVRRSIWQYARITEYRFNSCALSELGITRFARIYFADDEAFTPTPFTLPPCSPHDKADLRPPTWLAPRGSLRLGPPLRGLTALHEAALRRHGDRAGRGVRMGSFGSNKRMCDFVLCAAGHTMESGQGRRDGIPNVFFFGWNMSAHEVSRLNAAAFTCAFTFLRRVLS